MELAAAATEPAEAREPAVEAMEPAAVVGPAGAQDARDARDYAIGEPPVYALGREWVVEMLEAAGLPPTEAGVVEMLPVSAGIPGAQGATSGYVT